VTDAELEVLRALWQGGPLAIRQLVDAVYPRGGTSEYATVQKLLERLEDKGYVSRSRDGRRFLFAAQVGRDELVARRLRSTADQLCEGSLTPLLTHLVSAGDLTQDELEHLRRLVESTPDASAVTRDE
jgi:predicted transcriptional regulator